MKKLLILAIVMVVLATLQPLSAQMKFGIKAGLNLSSNSLSNVTDPSQKLQKESYNGFLVGPTVEAMFPFIGWGLDLSLLYSQKGIAFQDFGNASISYIDVPLNLKYKLGIPKLIGIYATAGPYISYAFADKITGDKLKALDINKFDLGANIGLGVELLNKLQVGATYSVGFMKNEVQSLDAATKISYRNGVMSLTATYFY